MQEIIVYTDGACKYNPGPGGYSAIIIEKDKKNGIKGNEKITTNNIMELTAAINALKYIITKSELYKINKNVLIKLHSDSAYVVDAISKGWLKNWEQKNWKTTTGDVKNVDLWKEMLKVLKYTNVEFIKVKGHSDDKLNNLCDKYAVIEADKAKAELINEAKEDGIEIDDSNLKEYIETIIGEKDPSKPIEKPIKEIVNENNIKEEIIEENIIDNFKEKDERQVNTITSLVIENSKLKNEIRELKEYIKKLEGEK